MSRGLELDYETADRITLLIMQDQRRYLQKELDDFDDGKYLHPEDVVKNAEIIKALNLLISYFGGT